MDGWLAVYLVYTLLSLNLLVTTPQYGSNWSDWTGHIAK